MAIREVPDGYSGASAGVKFALAAAFFFLALAIALPLIMTIVILLNFPVLGDDKFRKKYGIFYAGLAIRSRFRALFHVVFCIRRGLFALLLIFLN